jgi:DNA repair photolyase
VYIYSVLLNIHDLSPTMFKNPRKLPHKTRGALSNPAGRFERFQHEAADDGWYAGKEQSAPSLQRTVMPDRAKTIINYNRSPDIPFDRSINPYRGCEHGCIYCYARPTHSFLDLSPGLDFETRLFYKDDAVAKLEQALGKPGYRCQPIAFGVNTDAYQPLEREHQITRQLLEVLLRFGHPVNLITKSELILRDVDILQALASDRLVSVAISITSMQQTIKSTLEPRAASPTKRVHVIKCLSEAGIPCGVLVAPVIPAITDNEMEAILEQAFNAGAGFAGYQLLRLPHELKDVFQEWLQTHYPDRTAHVMSLLRQSYGGKSYNAEWGLRRHGSGIYADMLAQRFKKSCLRIGYADRDAIKLNTSAFRVPDAQEQLSMGF